MEQTSHLKGHSRRHFGKLSSAFIFSGILSARGANERLNLAVVGTGGRGGGNLAEVSGENIVALCDVNGRNLDNSARKHPKAEKFVDFRKIYDKASAIDAVVVSCSEHTHAFATLPALQLKKHVYCEKPLAYNIWETRKVMEAAKAAGVATQMGTQIHSGSNYRRVVELIRAGAIGDVSAVRVWVGRAWGLQSAEDAKKNGDIVSIQNRPTEAMTPPLFVDWDLWIGPAPWRPYHDVYFPGPKWYRWWDFGGGTMSDLGSHWNDLPFWALDLDAPTAVSASGPPPHPELAPASMSATFEFPARGSRKPLVMTWHQGADKPPELIEKKIPQWGSGVLFIGSKGMLLSDYGKYLLLPEADFADYKRPEKSIPESPGHQKEWLAACKTGSATTCPFSYSGLLTESNHLGNVAYRLGKRIEWDSKNLKCPNAPEADPLIRRNYRDGWTLG
ncbi:MAG: Gfo/Idh/MocA family protein [bacterium]